MIGLSSRCGPPEVHGEGRFVRSRADFVPAYVEAYAEGRLQQRVEQARDLLAPCRVCPRPCKDVDRLADKLGACRIGRYARVASAFPHFGEEDVLRGWRGSGTIFMAGCNLRCVFCQNGDISQRPVGREVNAGELAELMLDLQARGCHKSGEMRTAIELAIDTGRRPEEICALPFDCLTRDDDGLPVLVYDNLKGNRLGRRLPISESTAQVITDQKRRVRVRYPHSPVGQLKLLPTDRRNPDGCKAITPFSFAFHHRTWVDRMLVLRTADGAEFDRRKIVLYAYRHTYAQRHADAGVGVDVLRELMDHRKLDTTKKYYRVGEGHRREAIDRVAAMQFDRHGNRIWRTAQQLLDSEHTRRAVGEVAVPFGVCAEPSNVKAGGNACPFRFRCVGCDHFRTDVSYLPDLQAYLDDLLRNRERVLAATDVDEWARAEAIPSQEEITRVRRLIVQIHAGLDELTPDAQAQVERAVATVRRHRTGMLGMTRVRQSLPLLPPERTA